MMPGDSQEQCSKLVKNFRTVKVATELTQEKTIIRWIVSNTYYLRYLRVTKRRLGAEYLLGYPWRTSKETGGGMWSGATQNRLPWSFRQNYYTVSLDAIASQGKPSLLKSCIWTMVPVIFLIYLLLFTKNLTTAYELQVLKHLFGCCLPVHINSCY